MGKFVLDYQYRLHRIV